MVPTNPAVCCGQAIPAHLARSASAIRMRREGRGGYRANRADFWRATRAADHWPLTGGYFSSVTVKFWADSSRSPAAHYPAGARSAVDTKTLGDVELIGLSWRHLTGGLAM